MTRCAPAFSNATPPTVRTALTISRPQNCGAVFGRVCNRIDPEPNSPLRAGAYWSVYELTHRAPGSRRAAGSRSTRTESPRICWHTIFICGTPQWYGKPLKQRGLLSRQADIRRVTGTSSVNLRHQALRRGLLRWNASPRRKSQHERAPNFELIRNCGIWV